jgi:PAS domain S-box-containing protein
MMSGDARDLDPLVRENEALRQQVAALELVTRRHRATLQSIGDAVIATDAAGRITQMDPVAEALTGWRDAEACGRALHEVFQIVNEETRVTVESPVERVLREGTVVGLANHTVLLAKDKTERPIADSGAPIRHEKGGRPASCSCSETRPRSAGRRRRSWRASASSATRLRTSMKAITASPWMG